jgi:hypothetical protein
MPQAQVQITDLPQAQALTGAESVPIVQNGVTVQTTTGSIAGAGALNYPFLTVGSASGLTLARYLATGSGLSLTDNGAGGTLQINLTGAAQSLDSSGTGIQVKTGSNTLTGVSLAVGSGLSISNPDGVSGSPTISLGSFLSNFVSLTGTGMLAIQSGTVGKVNILGTTNQISILNGDGSGDVTIGLASNAVLPGNGSVTLPYGASGQRSGSIGAIRYNTDLEEFEGYTNTGWNQFSVSALGVTTFSAGSTGFTPNTDTTGAVTLGGILNAVSGGTGASGLTGYVYGNGAGAMTASTTIPTTALSGTISNAQLANSSITINGNSVSLGGSTTVTAATTSSLTIGTGLTGGSFDGSSPVTIAIDSTVATLSGVQTLTNKSISGSTNTLTNIPNSALTNSSVTIGTTSVSLGGSSLTLGGLTSVTVTQDPVSSLQLATKQYVDSVAQGLNIKGSVVWGTTANITLSGLGTQSGGEWTATLNAGDRILVKNQSSPANNGIYAAASGAWSRTSDANTWNQLVSAFTFIEEGATLGDTGWVCTVDPGGTLGVTPVTWVQFSGAGTYTAGTGLTLSGTQFSITNTGVSAASYGSSSAVPVLAINAQGQITSASTAALGTIAVQNANSVAITGGAVDGTIIGGTTPAAGTFTTLTSNSTAQFGKGSSNYIQAVGAATTLEPIISAQGSDTNIPLLFQPKGTGSIDLAPGSSGVNISNGGTVTAITRTAYGSNYTSIPTCTISPPTTAGGVQATANPQLSTNTVAINSGGTGYSVNDVLTVLGGTSSPAIQLTVSAVSSGVITAVTITNVGSYLALPTNPVSVSGGTGSGATFNISNWYLSSGFTITNAGSGYVEQPTVSFSGGGGSGATAYATVGSIPKIQTLGSSLSFYTPGGEQFRVVEAPGGGGNTVNYAQAQGRTTGNGPVFRSAGSDTNIPLLFSTKGTSQYSFYTNDLGSEQFRVAHTASAVNYVQVTGAATGGNPTISAQGSDSFVNMVVTSKSSGDLLLRSGSTGGYVRLQPNGSDVLRAISVGSAVNWINLSNSATGTAPTFSAQGSDTNIDLTLTPKGTGKLVVTNGIQGGSF